MRKKAQASAEFVILLSFMLLVFIMVTILIQKQMMEAKETKYQELTRQLYETINNELKISNSINKGYKREFYLPALIGGEPYQIRLESDEDLIITINNKEYVYFLDYNGSLITPLEPGKNQIRN